MPTGRSKRRDTGKSSHGVREKVSISGKQVCLLWRAACKHFVVRDKVEHGEAVTVR